MTTEQELEKRVRKAIFKAAATVERNAKLAIQQAPRGGKALNRMKEHRSAPGEPPATETGNLVNSIQQENIQDGIRVFVGARYGADLEYGTKKMAARPFWRPAVEKGKKIFEKALKS